MHSAGYFRTAQCNAELSVYGLWSTIETCELETPRHSVLIDECGVLIPYQTTTEVASGRLDGDEFVSENGTVLPVEMNGELSLDVGRGATGFNLLPEFESGLELPEVFRGLRGTMAVTEQVYEFQDGAVGIALNEAKLVFSEPWQTVVPYQGTGDGKVLLRSKILNVDLSVVSANVTINGLELARQISLCPGYEETFYLRERDGAIVLEQLINRAGQQTVLRRLYTFD